MKAWLTALWLPGASKRHGEQEGEIERGRKREIYKREMERTRDRERQRVYGIWGERETQCQNTSEDHIQRRGPAGLFHPVSPRLNPSQHPQADTSSSLPLPSPSTCMAGAPQWLGSRWGAENRSLGGWGVGGVGGVGEEGVQGVEVAWLY